MANKKYYNRTTSVRNTVARDMPHKGGVHGRSKKAVRRKEKQALKKRPFDFA